MRVAEWFRLSMLLQFSLRCHVTIIIIKRRKNKRREGMKTCFAPIILAVVMAMLLGGAISAQGADPVKNPTLKDMQGHWEGTLRTDGARSGGTRDVNLRIAGTKVTYNSETNTYVAKLDIKGEEINITAARRSDVCKLSKDSNTLILNCNWDMAANPQKNISKAYSGTMRLEKKDK
jgi:hypothetical protein